MSLLHQQNFKLLHSKANVFFRNLPIILEPAFLETAWPRELSCKTSLHTETAFEFLEIHRHHQQAHGSELSLVTLILEKFDYLPSH